MTYPGSFSHIGLSVTNLEQAVDFYTSVLGWYGIRPSTPAFQQDIIPLFQYPPDSKHYP